MTDKNSKKIQIIRQETRRGGKKPTDKKETNKVLDKTKLIDVINKEWEDKGNKTERRRKQ